MVVDEGLEAAVGCIICCGCPHFDVILPWKGRRRAVGSMCLISNNEAEPTTAAAAASAVRVHCLSMLCCSCPLALRMTN